MRTTQKVRLVGGPHDGKTVEIATGAKIVWTYLNMYDRVMAVEAAGLPRTPSMADYRVLPGTDMAEFIPSA